MAELTDPNIPAANKGNIVNPGIGPDDAGTIDDHLNRMNAFGGLLPPAFVVTDIEHVLASSRLLTANTARFRA
jgi:hypothetical protein